MKDKPCSIERIKKSILLFLAVLIPYSFVYFSEIKGFILTKPSSHMLVASAATINGTGIVKETSLGESLYKNSLPSPKREYISSKLKGLLGLKLDSVELMVNEERIAVLYDQEEAERVINNLKAHYIEKCSIQRSSISDIQVKGNIQIKNSEAYEWQMYTMDMALNSLIEACNKGLLQVETTITINELEEISPIVSIISTDNLSIGETSTEQGENGVKEKQKRIIYSNDNKVSEEILGETILKEARETIILKGSKITEDKLAVLLAAPSRGVISSGYGMRWGRLHRGTDYAANHGDPITAALDGVVVEADYIGTYGNVVILDHGSGIETLYAHCSEIKVSIGDNVKKGEVIALVGNTGRSTGPHLHFEVRINGEARDSSKYLK